jgi:hypothetical protein
MPIGKAYPENPPTLVVGECQKNNRSGEEEKCLMD